MGDFNAISNITETHEGSMRWCPAITDFKECLQHAKLVDFRFSGILYSWCNKSFGNACIVKKLDRALVNQGWTSSFPLSECSFLTPGISDHNPILTTFIKGTAVFQVVQKLKLLKPVLKGNCKKDFTDIDSLLHAVKLELDACQSDLDCSPSNTCLRQMERSFSTELIRLTNIQESMLRQKSKINCLKLRDSNTAYFHKSFSSRNNKKKILSLTTDAGILIYDKESIIEEIVAHFKGLLDTAAPPTHSLSDLCAFNFKQVPSHLLSSLSEIPSPLEIQNCLLHLNRDKALGPDGYNAAFFQKAWDIVGRSVTLAITEFFNNGKMLSEANNTYISLVPKCQNPSLID
ncbi:uncharacterized protein LOC132281074 [Cornus florida]|uniref:uncharacterized protein LOC132281074 n=1 Tax=Cornus florida TaxID=4283 RepID=UPI00289FCF58|nr:uncharacterized protein LOC132281074 [Cornus florida]